jgi:hypothetical protein
MHQAVSIYELNLSNSLPCLFFKSAIKSDDIEVMQRKLCRIYHLLITKSYGVLVVIV